AGDGIVDLTRLETQLAGDPRPAIVSVMFANNETGILQPVAEIARIAHAHGALFHCDAVQGAGKLPLAAARIGADCVALSALDLAGVMVSAGAACSSGKVGPSHVLAAMGTPPEIAGATIRISLGWSTTEADIAHFLDAWTALSRRRSRRAA